MKTFVLALAVSLSMLLAACGQDEPTTPVEQTATAPQTPVVMGPPAPQQVAPQAPAQPIIVEQQSDPNSGLFTGMLLGHMFSNSGSTNRTVVEHRYQPAPRASAPRSSYRAPAYRASRPSYKASRPSYSRPSYRSSRPSYRR